MKRALLALSMVGAGVGCGGLLGVDFSDARPATTSDGGPATNEDGSAEGAPAVGPDGGAACSGVQVECLAADGSIACCAPAAELGTPIVLAAGGHETCAITSTGAIACWGANERGQLGAGAAANAAGSSLPVRVRRIPGGAEQVSVGGAHVCAVVRALGDGPAVLACWGSNSDGQLGNGTQLDAPLPIVVKVPRSIEVVGAGAKTTCASLGGRAYCWGANDQLQAGSATDSVILAPRLVAGLAALDADSVTKKRHVIVPSDKHTCAALDDTTSVCWGDNAHARLGQPTPARTASAVDLPGFTGDDLAIGESHGCELGPTFVPFGSDAGPPVGETVFCWGSNELGQIGDGHPAGDESQEILTINGMKGGVTSLCAGANHTCAVQNGNVYCWGKDDLGQCGSITPSRIPAKVDGLDGLVAWQVACGATHTCALFEGGTVKCWGSNEFGERGDGTNSAAASTPRDVIW